MLARTEISAQTACLSPAESICSNSTRKRLLEFCTIRNTSFRMSSATRFLRSSGEICKALTRKDNNTSMMFSTLPSYFPRMILFLCSWRTFSEKSCYFSSLLSSVSKILWYFPKSTLYASIASPRLSAFAFPSFNWCKCCRQLTLMVKMARAERS